jgi:hypothetical protein
VAQRDLQVRASAIWVYGQTASALFQQALGPKSASASVEIRILTKIVIFLNFRFLCAVMFEKFEIESSVTARRRGDYCVFPMSVGNVVWRKKWPNACMA